MVFFFLCLDDVLILSDVVVVQNVIHIQDGVKVIYDSSRKVKQQLAHRRMRLYLASFEKIFYLALFRCTNYHLTARYKTGKRPRKT